MLKKKKHFSCEIANSLQLLVCCHNLSFITLSGKGIPLKWESQYNTIFESHLIVTSTLWNLCLELKGYVFRSIGSTHSYYCLSCPAFIGFFFFFHVLKKKKKSGKVSNIRTREFNFPARYPTHPIFGSPCGDSW